jgi:hypothetical protein
MPWGAIAAIGGAMINSESNSDASKEARWGQNASIRAMREGEERAKAAAIPLFDASQRNALAGFQGALDIQGQFAPAQIDAFQQGNMQAQDTMRAGLDPQIAAILGGNIDLSGLQSQQVNTPDPSMFQHQLPDFSRMIDILPNEAAQYIPGAREELLQRAIDNPGTANPSPDQYMGIDEIMRNVQANYNQNQQPSYDANWNGVPAINMLSGGLTGAYPPLVPPSQSGGTPPTIGWGGPQNPLGGG